MVLLRTGFHKPKGGFRKMPGTEIGLLVGSEYICFQINI